MGEHALATGSMFQAGEELDGEESVEGISFQDHWAAFDDEPMMDVAMYAARENDYAAANFCDLAANLSSNHSSSMSTSISTTISASIAALQTAFQPVN